MVPKNFYYSLYIERVFVTESYACEAGVLGVGVNFNSNFVGARNFVDGLRDICNGYRISIVSNANVIHALMLMCMCKR